MVTDLSGNEGNGVPVNERPFGEARLKKGDLINIGEVELHFDQGRYSCPARASHGWKQATE